MTSTQHKTKERAEEETERRRKRGGGELHGRRLAVVKSMLDFDNFAYRWINDDPGRIYAMTQEDDWDFITNNGEKDDSADLGARVSQVVGSNADGSKKVAYLCRKRKAYYKEDQAAKARELDEQLAQIRNGNDRTGAPQSDYVPTTGIRIGA